MKMKATETVETVAGITGIVGVLYLQVLDGLKTEVMIVAILTIAGLGGYRVLKEWLNGKGGGS